jgi:hypothetical protein
MTPTLIVLALLALGVGIVVWFTRKKPTSAQRDLDEDTAWNDPVSRGSAATTPTDDTVSPPFADAAPPTEPEVRP